jgi:uncharacterized protein (TIGR02246 family)
MMQMTEEALAQSNRRFADAAAAGDAEAMASVYTDDAELLPPNTETLRGRSAIERFWQGAIEMGIRGLELETLQLEQTDGLAYEIGHYTLNFEPRDGAHVTDLARYVVVHRRHDGRWQRAVEIFNWNTPWPDEQVAGSSPASSTR